MHGMDMEEWVSEPREDDCEKTTLHRKEHERVTGPEVFRSNRGLGFWNRLVSRMSSVLKRPDGPHLPQRRVESMRREERMVLTAVLRTGSLVVGTIVAYLASLGIFSVAIANNVPPNTAYGGAVLVFVAILAVWIGKLVVKIRA